MPSMRPRCTTAAQLNSKCSHLQRQPDDGQQRQALGGLAATARRPSCDAVEQRALMEQVVARVRGQAELGEQRDHARRSATPAP